MLIIATSRPSLALMTAVSVTDSSVAVEDEVSSCLSIVLRCLLPPAAFGGGVSFLF
jgi:hypothetical protein